LPTNLTIEDALLKKALKAGGLRTKKETVTKALEEFIQRRQQRKILWAMGSIEFREEWNYKVDRQDRESGR
jgi:Arc/MetJ family transcription regulator